MFEQIIRFSIEQRWVVLLIVLGMSALGFYNYQQLPIDAVPDITNVQVQINTSASGYSPLEAEQRITFPVAVSYTHLDVYKRQLLRWVVSEKPEWTQQQKV